VTGRILLIARNAFRSIMSRRAVYIWGAGVLLMFLRSAPAVFTRGTDERLIMFLRANAIAGALDIWSLLCVAAAILLSAGAVATEISTKTIVTVMARPVWRWEVLLGKWLGVSAFVLLTMAIGLALALGLARYLGIEVDRPLLGLALSHTAVAVLIYGAVAVVLGSFGSWVIAAALTVLLAFMPQLIDRLTDLEDSPGWRRVGIALDWVIPDGYTTHYLRITAAPPLAAIRGPAGAVAQRLQSAVDYGEQRGILYGNILYGAAYFVAGCVAFSRRNIYLT
jgi:hypothetical protein